MIQAASSGQPGIAGNNVDRSSITTRLANRFHISARGLRTPPARIQHHAWGERTRQAVVSVYEKSSLVTVTVTTQDQIHTVGLQKRHYICSHANQVVLEIRVV